MTRDKTGRGGARLTSILLRLREEPGAAAVKDAGDLLGRLDDQGAALQVIARHELAVRLPGVHSRQVILHSLRRQEVDVLQTEGPADVLLDEIVEGQPCFSVQDDAGPVDANLRGKLVSLLTSR